MRISAKDWAMYTARLSRLGKTAESMMREYIAEHGEEEIERLWDFAFGLVTKYGEGAASLACEMYDALAEAQGAKVPPASPAYTARLWETEVAMKGTTDAEKPAAVSRLVKRSAADTTLKNAIRDHAEFAWIPSGDSCAFCLTLASRGWQPASKNSLKNGHAEHIHANCDCQYAIRFDQKSTVQGYDPEKLLEKYNSFDGNSEEKINAWRREIAQEERARDVLFSEQSRIDRAFSNKVPLKALDAPGYVDKFNSISANEDVNRSIYESSVEILKHRTGTDFEDLYLIDGETGAQIYAIKNSGMSNGVIYDDTIKQRISEAHREGRKIIAVHNHPNGLPPTLDDGSSAFSHGYDYGIVVGHNLEVYTYTKSLLEIPKEVCDSVHQELSKSIGLDIDFEESKWYDTLKKFGMEVNRK